MNKHSYSVFIFVFLLFNAVLSQKLLKGPYLLEPGSTDMTIRWELSDSVSCFIRYDESKQQPARLRGKKDKAFLYEVQLTALQPAKKYVYRISCSTKDIASSWFKTFSSKDENIHFVAMGDSRSHPDIFKTIIQQVQEDEPDFVISMGDLVADGGDYEQWGKYYFDVAAPLINHIPLVSCLGDHETGLDDGELFRYFLRKKEVTGKQWFSFDYGNAHFVALDYRHAENPEMIDWFKKDMQQTNAKWKFVYMHRPCYNLGGHRSHWGREVWPALFSEYKIDLVFAGHSHIYERFYPLRPDSLPFGWPVTYITTGGGGAGLYDVTQGDFLAKAESVNHYVNIWLYGDTLRLQARRMDGTILDKMIIIKSDNSYDDSYLAEIKSQDHLDLLTMFMKAISRSISKVPLYSKPAKINIELKSNIRQNIAFHIGLSDSSKTYYQAETLSGTLNKGMRFKARLPVFRKAEIRISPWGDMQPPLRLKAVFSMDGREETILGGAIEYWPDDEDY